MSMNTGAGAGAAARNAGIPGHMPSALRHDWIAFVIRRLEPLIAGSISLYTAWIAAAVLPAEASLWLFALYAGFIAVSSWCRPARYQPEVLMRALALVAGYQVLHTQTPIALSAAGSVYLFWLSVTTLYYAVILKPGWALALVAAATAAMTLSNVTDVSTNLESVAASLGFLMIFPVGLALRSGLAVHCEAPSVARSHLDARTGLYNMAGFMVHGADALQACAVDGRPATLVVMDCADLQEVRSIYGRTTSRKVMSRLVRKLNAIAGERGVVARTSPAEFALLLPGMPRDKACLAIDRVLGRPGCIEYDAGDSEIVMVPNFTVAALDCGPEGLSHAFAVQRAQIQHRIRQQAEHERYLTLERERYSRPAPLAPLGQMPPAASAHASPGSRAVSAAVSR